MRVKSYFAPTVETAIRRARTELGENAVILNSREAPAEARHLGRYEVVFGCDESRDTGPPGAAEAEAVNAWPEALDLIRRELRELGRQNWMRGMGVRGSGLGAATGNANNRPLPILATVSAFLERRGVTATLAAQISERVGNLSPADPAKGYQLHALLTSGLQPTRRCFDLAPGETSRRLALELQRIDPQLTQLLAELERQVCAEGEVPSGPLAFVGPPGVGKTTLLIKAAVRLGARSRRPVRVVSADGVRVGAGEQLRRLAAILGASFEFHETPGGLTAALQAPASSSALVLVDTPGWGPSESNEMNAWATAIRAAQAECYLVLPATWGFEELEAAVARFKPFAPHRLAVTQLDLCEAPGRLISLSAETRCPISLLSFGSSIPEDAETASPARLVDLLVAGRADVVLESTRPFQQPTLTRQAA